MKPIIGIVSNYYPENMSYFVKHDYVSSVCMAGGVPVLWTREQRECIPQLLEQVDGVLIPGGPDVSPLCYGENPITEVTYSVEEQDLFELEVVKACVEVGKPLFGICRGAQVINVALGGTLYQDIYKQAGASLCHQQDMSIRSQRTHLIHIQEGTMFHSLIGCTSLAVNSYHHQAVKNIANGLRVTAWSEDGIVEAFEGENFPVLGVQFHPENLAQGCSCFLKLFQKLIHWE